MKRKSVKKGIAVALAATMTGGVLPAAAVTQRKQNRIFLRNLILIRKLRMV